MSCDQLGFLEEGLHHLSELVTLTNTLALAQESVDEEPIAFEYLYTSSNHLNEGVIKQELAKISEKFQNESCSNKKFLKSPEAKKKHKKKPFWKRSLGWWKKQIIEVIATIGAILECLDTIESKLDDYNKQNPVSDHNKQN